MGPVDSRGMAGMGELGRAHFIITLTFRIFKTLMFMGPNPWPAGQDYPSLAGKEGSSLMKFGKMFFLDTELTQQHPFMNIGKLNMS